MMQDKAYSSDELSVLIHESDPVLPAQDGGPVLVTIVKRERQQSGPNRIFRGVVQWVEVPFSHQYMRIEPTLVTDATVIQKISDGCNRTLRDKARPEVEYARQTAEYLKEQNVKLLDSVLSVVRKHTNT